MASHDKLEGLVQSMNDGILVGLYIVSSTDRQFVITRVNRIDVDPQNEANKLIAIHQPDYNGKMLQQNPVHLTDIVDVRVYKPQAADF
ncbi:hypothetical protein [Ohtaekwangia sp.]|uniref:hypothetical protein n=1 Tax=Ohtaekwangia sp. TaxID=2066019 RepID=UPI002F92F3D0